MGFTMIQWNCRSLSNKLEHFKCPPFSSSHVLILQETFLNPDKHAQFDHKTVYRLDRANRPGGGLLIAVHSSIASYPLTFHSSTHGNEIMGVRILLSTGPINIINVYSPTGQVSHDLLRVSSSIQGPSFICGDFNSHHPLWGATTASKHSEDFAQWILNSEFCLLNSQTSTHVAPSGKQSIIDLSFCSSDLLTKTNFQVHEDLFDSDHFPILLTLAIHPPLQILRPRFHWKNISLDVNNSLEHRSSVTFPGFMHTIRKSMDTHRSYTSFARPSFPPWWSPRCQNLFLQKKFLLKKATSLISLEFWARYKRTAAKLRQVIKEAKRHFWDLVCSKAQDPRILYHTLRKFQTRSSTSPDSHYILQNDDALISDASIQSEILVDHFSAGVSLEPLPLDFSENEPNQLNTSFSLFELQDAIRRTKNTTPGEDKISANFFKGLSEHSQMLLLQLYNESWQTGKIPDDWKSAIIIPICKPGKSRRQLASYRPIALTSVMCKICERMIVRRLYTHLTSQKIIDPRILGFLPFRDSHSALALLHSDISIARAEKKFIIGVSLDIQAAYDSVYIDGLALKCAQVGITGNALLWIYNLLCGRRIKVSWRNMISSSRVLKRGVPQGSVLSPVLFAIFMSDFFEALPAHVKGLVYADDVFIYCSDVSLGHCKDLLQKALRSISQWCTYWKLLIRADKCHAINLSRRFGDCDTNFFINSGTIG